MREGIGFACNAIFVLPRAPMGPLRSQGYGLGQTAPMNQAPTGRPHDRTDVATGVNYS